MKPLTKPTLLLVRHGDTPMNDRNELRGMDNPPLNDDGHRQAAAAADHIRASGVPLHHIYSGTLDRTKSTAAHISAATGVNATQTPKLDPWDYGDLTGQPENAANKKKLKFLQDRPHIPAAGGESYNAFTQRYGDALNRAREYVHLYPEKAVVLVTHSRNLYPTPHLLGDESKPIPVKDDAYGPGSVHRVEFGEGGRAKITKER
jgi:broad specificity phosphatase PhoE